MIKAKLDDINIVKEHPFKNDVLDRKENIEMLTGVIESVHTPVVLALDSNWGSGKTTFVKLWKQYLENNKFRCIYYNAWENDFCNDPMISMMGEIDMGIKDFDIDVSNKFKIIKEMKGLKNMAACIAKKVMPTIAKLSTSGMLDIDKVYEKILSDFASDISKDAINQYENSKNVMVSFKEKLKNIIELVKSDGADKPFVFFIDELDRCRPDFSVELLEKAKHIFSVQGVVFVLSVDKKQLGCAVKSLYGNEMDVEGYLKRFIDIDYKLPVNSSSDFAMHLFDKFNISLILKNKDTNDSSISSYDIECLIAVFNKLSYLFEFSLRTQEKCFSRIAAVIHFTDRSEYIVVELLILIVFLRELNKEYDAKKYDYSIIDYINDKDGGREFFETDAGYSLKAAIETGHDDLNINSLYEKYNLDEKDLTPDNIKSRQHIMRCIDKIKNTKSLGSSSELLKKIELVGGLNFSSGLHNIME